MSVVEELSNLRAEREQLLKEIERLKNQASLVKNYRLQNVAIPIMASMFRYDCDTNADELASWARIACEAANTLLTEIDERWPST